MLIILGGLPGVGKTSIARELATQLGAVHIRIDSIEDAIRQSGVKVVSIDDAGYRVGYALAEDNLRLGHMVIADSVNPLSITRDAWFDAAKRAGVECLEVEIVCNDAIEHRRRVEERTLNSSGLKPPTWMDVLSREYEPWVRDHLTIDTSSVPIDEATTKIVNAVAFTRDARPISLELVKYDTRND